MAVLSDAQREAGWTVVKLGDIATVVTGQTPSKKFPEHWGGKGEIPFLTPKDQAIGIRSVETERYISKEYSDIYEKRIVPEGAVALTCIGSLGKISIVQTATLTNQQINSIIPDGSKANNLYIYYYLMSSYDSLESLAGGTVMPIVNKSSLEGMEIPLPSLGEQERIAGILGSLDDKIEANTRLIQTLSDYCVALVESLKLFDGSRESTLGEIIAFSPKVKKPAGEEYQFIDMNSLPTLGPVPETISSKSSWSGAKFENGDTLFARITPCLENGKTAIAMGLGDEPACGSTEFIVMRANTPEQVILPYGIARCDKFRQEAMSHMIGSTGRQRVKWQDLASIPVSVPSESDMQKIEKASNIFGYFEALRKENLQLAETRDALIKRLIG